MTIGQDMLTKAETITVAAIEAGIPALVKARERIAEFHLMIQRKAEVGLTPWIERARSSLVISFASGVANDEAAVRAATTSSCPTARPKVDYVPQARQTSNVRSRENRSASSPTNRFRIIGAAPKLRQSQFSEPTHVAAGRICCRIE